MKKNTNEKFLKGAWRIPAWQAAAAVVLFLAAVAAGALGSSRQVKDPEMAQVVMRLADRALTNQDLAYYFWTEYYYALGSGAAIDTAVALDAQQYDQTRTWEQYLLENVEQTMVQTLTLAEQAEAAQFQLPASQQAELEQLPEILEQSAISYGYTDEAGAAEIETYLSQSYGAGVDEASFVQFMEDSYLAAAYAEALYDQTTFSDEEVASYYEAFADDYMLQGVLQTEDRAVQIRDILIVPQSTQQEDWDAARQTADQLLQIWQQEGATEEVFASLAMANSMDSDNAPSGGLRAFLNQEGVDTAIAGWSFDPSRAPGDTTVLQAADGYHVLYFCSISDHPYWYERALDDLRYESYVSTLRQLVEQAEYTFYPQRVVLHTPGSLSA
ncbi:MAG: peptidylprolyl isomerase [Clostridiales bacterium]|nr:peptidylprolyl isomerase [Clostridiales bacterium]